MLRKVLQNKMGIIIGTSIAVLLVFFHIFSSRSQDKWELLSAVDLSMNLGVIIGGAISGFIVEHYFVHRFSKMGIIIGSVVGSISISPLAVYYGIIFGGLSGMAFLGFLMGFVEIKNVKEIVAFIGMFFGIAVVVVIVESVGAVIGSVIGFLVERLLNIVHRVP
jgi:hypothetical protein